MLLWNFHPLPYLSQQILGEILVSLTSLWSSRLSFLARNFLRCNTVACEDNRRYFRVKGCRNKGKAFVNKYELKLDTHPHSDCRGRADLFREASSLIFWVCFLFPSLVKTVIPLRRVGVPKISALVRLTWQGWTAVLVICAQLTRPNSDLGLLCHPYY